MSDSEKFTDQSGIEQDLPLTSQMLYQLSYRVRWGRTLILLSLLLDKCVFYDEFHLRNLDKLIGRFQY